MWPRGPSHISEQGMVVTFARVTENQTPFLLHKKTRGDFSINLEFKRGCGTMLTPRRQEMGDDGVTMSRGEEMGDQAVGGKERAGY